MKKIVSTCISRLGLSGLLVLLLVTKGQGQDPATITSAQDDWWLPDWVEASDNGGFYGGYGQPSDVNIYSDVKLTWKEVEPVEGQYDWSRLEAALAEGEPAWIRFFASDVTHCPDWLKEKYPDLRAHRYRWPDGGYDDITCYNTIGETCRSAGDFYEIWDERFSREFAELLLNFKEQGFGTDPLVKFAYFPHGWRWNEWTIKWIPEMTAAGTTPEQYMQWFHQTADQYIDAFGGEAGKLVYTGDGRAEWIEFASDQMTDAQRAAWDEIINPDGKSAMAQYCLEQGMGVRNGFTEVFNGFATAPDWGITLREDDGYRYSVVDEKHPLIQSRSRFFGTENEDFDYLWPDVFHYYYLRMAVLNSLRLRMNWQFLGDYRLAPELLNYTRLVQGKHYDNAPDAWVALRQYRFAENYKWFDGVADTAQNLRHFERWLYQREVADGGQTQPAYWVDYPPDFAETNGAGSYEAIRTDRASGNNYMYFDVDDKFIDGNTPDVYVKVTYRDDFAGTWQLQYDAQGSESYRAVSHANRNDGQWKTVTFHLLDAGLRGRQAEGMDFRLYNGGQHDLTVSTVRIIKGQDPTPVAAETVAATEATTSVDAQGNLLRNGEKFFPVGSYGPNFQAQLSDRQEALRIMAEAGFNTIVLEDISTPTFGEILDQADQQGIGVLVGITSLKDNQLAQETVETYRDKPAVLGWSLLDDADNGAWTLDEITERNTLVKGLDPKHVTYQTLTGYYPARRDAVAQYASRSDAIALQIYPIEPLPDYDVTDQNALTQTYLRTLQYVLAAEQYQQPMIMNAQTFRWFENGNPNVRYPTVSELRNMCYTGLAAGIKGIISYDFSSDLYNNQPALWDEWVAIKGDILDRTQNFYLNGTLMRYDTENSALVASSYVYRNKLLLLVVNTSYTQALPVDIAIASTYQSATPLFDRMPATLKLSDRRMQGTIAPQAVQVYELSPAPTDAAGRGLTYALHDNQTLDGNPVAVGTDAQVDFNWKSDGKATDLPANNFSVRWTGQVEAQYDEEYTFYTRSDDGVRLWVDGERLINNWTNHAVTEDQGKIILQAGQKYDIKLEYFENKGKAVCELRWSSASQAKQIVPKENLYPEESSANARRASSKPSKPGEEASGIRVFPNPSSDGWFTVRGSDATRPITLYDGHGRRVAVRTQAGQHGVRVQPQRRLPPGLYLLRVSQTDGRLHQQKVVLK